MNKPKLKVEVKKREYWWSVVITATGPRVERWAAKEEATHGYVTAYVSERQKFALNLNKARQIEKGFSSAQIDDRVIEIKGIQDKANAKIIARDIFMASQLFFKKNKPKFTKG